MITNKLLAYVAGTILLGAAFPMAFASAATYSPSMANGGTSSSASNENSLVPAMTPGNTTTSGTMNETGKNLSGLFSAFSRNIIVGTISGSIGTGKQPDWLLGGNFVLMFKSNSTTGTASVNGTGMSTSDNNTYAGQALIGKSSTTGTNLAGSNTSSSNQNNYAGQAMVGNSGSATNLTGNNNSSGSTMTSSNNFSFNESRLASLFPDISANQITNVTGLYAMIVMVKPDGSELHTHMLSNFTQTENATTNGNTTTINGTSTITVKGMPINDVPTSIKISTNNGTTIAISFDKPSVSRHFDNSSIYGIGITKALIDSVLKEHQMMYGSMFGTSTSSLTAGEMGAPNDHNNMTTFEEEAMKGTP